MIRAKYVALVTEVNNAYKIFARNPEGNRPLGRCRRRWKDTIRMCLRVIGWEIMDSIRLARDNDQWRALVNTVMNLRVP
jgi:hypothetical protein